MKVIIIDTPKGEYRIPLIKIAKHRANHLCDYNENDPAFRINIDFIMNDDYEGINWIVNYTSQEYWDSDLIRHSDVIFTSEADFWSDEDNFRIVELDTKARIE